MRLFNQSKNALAWAMSGVSYGCEAWGPVDVLDEHVEACKARGLPLATLQVPAESRARIQVAEEQAAANEAPLLALRKQRDDALANERATVAELERMQSDLTAAQKIAREDRSLAAELHDKLLRANADKDAAEKLLSEASAEATKSEARAIKAEALLAEATKAKKPAGK